MPANSRWDLIRSLRVKGIQLSRAESLLRGLLLRYCRNLPSFTESENKNCIQNSQPEQLEYRPCDKTLFFLIIILTQ